MLLFGLAARRNGVYAVVLGCASLFAAFHGTMYNLFHIAAPSSYLFQLSMIFCFWRYMNSGRWYYATGMILLLGPAMGRQTTAVILTAVLIVFTFERLKKHSPLWKRTVFAGAAIGAQLFMTTLNQNIGYGSVVTILPDYAKVYPFLHERNIYYGTLLTSGLTGLFALLLVTAGTFHSIINLNPSKYLC